jgi:branched-chain amino acid transport system permease protein
METFLQQLVNGLTLGSIYALVALGYTMVYGILELINFAHGEVVMVGALVAISLINLLLGIGWPVTAALVAALIVAMAVCMSLGFVIERVAYRPLRNAPRLAPLITAIGISMALQQLASLIWGRSYISFPAVFTVESWSWGEVIVTSLQFIIVVVSLLIMAGLMWLIQKTPLGRAMRATAQNPAAAQLMGVNTHRIISLTFIIGSALAAVAGVMVAAYYGVGHYTMGFMLGLKAFTAAVLGGIGNLPGAMVGGLVLGVVESLGAGYIGDLTGGVLGSNYKDVFAFLVLIAVLVFHPTGLMGSRAREKV